MREERNLKQKQNKRKKRLIISSIVAILVVLGVVAALAFNNHQNNNQNAAQTTTTSQNEKNNSATKDNDSESETSAAKNEDSATSNENKPSDNNANGNGQASGLAAFNKLSQQNQTAILTQWAWGGNADVNATYAVAEGQAGGVIYIRMTTGGGQASLGGWLDGTKRINDDGQGNFTVYSPVYNGPMDGSPIPAYKVTWKKQATINANDLMQQYQASGVKIVNNMDMSQLNVSDPSQLH